MKTMTCLLVMLLGCSQKENPPINELTVGGNNVGLGNQSKDSICAERGHVIRKNFNPNIAYNSDMMPKIVDEPTRSVRITWEYDPNYSWCERCDTSFSGGWVKKEEVFWEKPRKIKLGVDTSHVNMYVAGGRTRNTK